MPFGAILCAFYICAPDLVWKIYLTLTHVGLTGNISTGGKSVLDVLFVGLALLLFALMAAYVGACDKL
jgi:hypothetical protein